MTFFVTIEDIEKKDIISFEIEPPGGVCTSIKGCKSQHLLRVGGSVLSKKIVLTESIV